jgi:hypothetical protein
MKIIFLTLAAFLCFLCSTTLCQTNPSSISKGVMIVEDTTIFPKEFVELYQKARRGDTRVWSVGMRVPDGHHPKIDIIIEKYGKPDQVLEEEWWGMKATPDGEPMQTPMLVYCYGRFFLGVLKDDGEKRVVFVLRDKGQK